jgi:hypothetical protein
MDFKGNAISALRESKTACDKLDESKVKTFKKIIRGIGNKFTTAIKFVKKGNFKTVEQRINDNAL